MKHIPYFNHFLSETVNLNQNRLNTLNQRVETITSLLKAKLDGYRKYSLQGSYAHQTIIRPVKDNDEFDADILVFIKTENFNSNEFEDYGKQIHSIFKDDGNYKDKIRLNTRCVTIDYAGDFHLDIVPCIEHNDVHYICNRTDKIYEETDGDGYKQWISDKNTLVSGNNFRKSTRLFKFLRDHKDNFSVKSILLTTLLGEQVNDFDDYSDLPTTLKTLSNKVNVFLHGHYSMPKVCNPVLQNENFNRHWDEAKYLNFRNMFNLYNKKINDAFDESNHNESVKKWRKLFGDDFGELKDISTAKKTVASVTTASILSGGIATTKPYADNDFIQR